MTISLIVLTVITIAVLVWEGTEMIARLIKGICYMVIIMAFAMFIWLVVLV